MTLRRSLARAYTGAMLSASQRHHLRDVHLDDAGHGWDRFGMSREGVAFGQGHVGIRGLVPLYEHYLRVQAHGAGNIPREGPTIVVANHSGMLPLDGMMLWTDIVLQTEPARVPRPVADFFVPALPFINIIFARGGVIGGTRGNVHAALEAGELLELFPEGVHGIGKGFSQRYRLQRWSVGHAELAIRHRAAIVPTAIIGAEESWPQVAKIESLRALGIPYLPIPATPLPIPVQFAIHYGDPIRLTEDYDPAQADDPGVLRDAAMRVRMAVEDLIAHGLRQREGLFG